MILVKCKCKKRFALESPNDRLLCKCGNVVYGLEGRCVERPTRFDSAVSKRQRIAVALKKRGPVGDVAVSLIDRLDNGSKLKAYLKAWIEECGCQVLDVAARLNSMLT